ncbi:hypothetical protein HDF10_002375 [Edaphobacter lichenicola]|uniref:Uncharacterized protein n=1 Tax=Tunturiibacter lichenicola TaxID=2051959 RepID=A0A7W8J8D0_9BACT|nr:hypothetical protein [Edaphobacter lichenicola]
MVRDALLRRLFCAGKNDEIGAFSLLELGWREIVSVEWGESGMDYDCYFN